VGRHDQKKTSIPPLRHIAAKYLRQISSQATGTRFKHRIAEVHATSMKRLSKVEAADDPTDGAGDE
jgi:hypothetical protein